MPWVSGFLDLFINMAKSKIMSKYISNLAFYVTERTKFFFFALHLASEKQKKKLLTDKILAHF